MIRFRFLFAIANHIFQHAFERPLRQPFSKIRSVHSCPFKRSHRLGQGSLIAVTLLILGSQPAMADATVLSFDLDRESRQHEALPNWDKANWDKANSDSEDSSESTFSLQQPQSTLVAAAPLAISQSVAQSSSAEIPEAWWHQGAESPIAVAIGNAEGTRRADGSRTTAYYWHVDPGNGANNFGTFSYQHFPSSMTITVQRQATPLGKREAAAQAQLPEMADHEQIKRLRNFYDELQAQAAAHNLQLSQIEMMNGLDLANQSEAAALSVEGYIDRLAQMKGLEESVEEQILEARSWSYWDPDRRHWNAPGLGNHYDSVRRDQERRYQAIRQALDTYAPPNANSKASTVGQSSVLKPSSHRASAQVQTTAFGDAIANRIIDFNLPS